MNNRLDVLENKVQLLTMMLETHISTDEFSYYSFAITNDLTRKDMKVIANCLSIFSDYIKNKKIDEEHKNFYKYDEPYSYLLSASELNYNDFDKFIKDNISVEINTLYLLKSLYKQNINKDTCEILISQNF